MSFVNFNFCKFFCFCFLKTCLLTRDTPEWMQRRTESLNMKVETVLDFEKPRKETETKTRS